MRKCEYCESDVQPDHGYCEACGCNLLLQSEHLGLQWTSDTAQANNLHWLAQCQRRLQLPIESTEEIPFIAFEYGWKVLNRLYDSFPTSSEHAKERIFDLFEHFDVTQEIIDNNRESIIKLCDCVTGKKGDILFDDASSEVARKNRDVAIRTCTKLEDAINNGSYNDAAKALITSLYAVRNGRIHAVTHSTKSLPVGGSGESRRIRQGNERYDQEINVATEILLRIGKILLSSETGMPVVDIEKLVSSRVSQIATEIFDRVRKWRPKESLVHEVRAPQID